MLRAATPADRPDLIALALAEDAAWSGAAAVSADEVGEYVDSYGPGVVFATATPATRGGSRGWRRTASDNAIGLYRDVGFEVDREWRVYSRSAT
jgi:hypothetical protein